MALILRETDPLDSLAALSAWSEPCSTHTGATYSSDGLVEAVENSFLKYKEHGPRSPEKLKPLHQYIASVLAGIWGEPFRICYMGERTKEMKVEGKYYPKDIDITVTTPEGKPVFCLGIKFVTSNYKQNANNYFEGMMGETANIQALKHTPYAQLIILRYKTPYYKKNESGTASKTEIIDNDDIRKYIRLIFDDEQAHRPRYIGIQLVNIDEKRKCVSLTKLEECEFIHEISKLLSGTLSLQRFFESIKEYRDCFVATIQ
jgi:hypothetical protein